MGGNVGVFARHGIQYARNALRNVVLDDVANEERSQYNADCRIEQEEELRLLDGKPVGQTPFDSVEQLFEDVGTQTGQHTYDNGQQRHDLLVAESFGLIQEPEIDPFAPLGQIMQVRMFHGRNGRYCLLN